MWDQIQQRAPVGTARTLVIASDVAAILNLPWELLRFPGSDFAGFDPTVHIRRLPRVETTLPPFVGTLPPRPLRVLFMACAPQDQDQLDYEREEELLLGALSQSGDVTLDSGDLGTFEELRDRIHQFQPQMVHLTGHGVVARYCQNCRQINGAEADQCTSCQADLTACPSEGFFAFENERGATDLRSAGKIAQELFSGSGVQCAFISGCQSGKAPAIDALGGLCQGLIGSGLPLAIIQTLSTPKRRN